MTHTDLLITLTLTLTCWMLWLQGSTQQVDTAGRHSRATCDYCGPSHGATMFVLLGTAIARQDEGSPLDLSPLMWRERCFGTSNCLLRRGLSNKPISDFLVGDVSLEIYLKHHNYVNQSRNRGNSMLGEINEQYRGKLSLIVFSDEQYKRTNNSIKIC